VHTPGEVDQRRKGIGRRGGQRPNRLLITGQEEGDRILEHKVRKKKNENSKRRPTKRKRKRRGVK